MKNDLMTYLLLSQNGLILFSHSFGTLVSHFRVEPNASQFELVVGAAAGVDGAFTQGLTFMSIEKLSDFEIYFYGFNFSVNNMIFW